MRFIGKLLAGLVGGLIAGLFAMFMAFMIPSANDPAGFGHGVGIAVFIGFIVLAFVLAFTSITAGTAWRKTMLLCAALAAFFPIAMLIVMGLSAPADMDTSAAVGVAIGGGIGVTFSAVVGFSVALVFLIISRMCGRDAQSIVYVERGRSLDQ